MTTPEEPTRFEPYPRVWYVTFPTLHEALGQPNLTVAAQLRVPTHGERAPSTHATGPFPAVVIVHGSSGVDTRGSVYASALNNAGIVTLEVDLWTPRGLAGGLNRPKSVPETLPDAFGALKYLAGLEVVDAARIGVMGFSWGGIVSMLTATQPYLEQFRPHLPSGLRFAAHAPFYPVCWQYNRVPGYDFQDLTGAPVFIQVGEADTYDEPGTYLELLASLTPEQRAHVTARSYPNATHAWDRLQPAVNVFDPHANLGRGGHVDFTPNPEVTTQSRAATVAFFRSVFGG